MTTERQVTSREGIQVQRKLSLSRSLTDDLVDLLIETIHQIGARAERKVERELLDDLKRVTGKQNLLFELADATLAQPDGIVRDVFHVFGALAQFERRLIAERTRDGMNAARAKGSRPGRPPLNPENLEAALLLVKGGISPTKAARQTALGHSTLYREIQARDHCLSS